MKTFAKQLRPRQSHSYIRQVVDVGDGFVILETVHDYPAGVSNMYKVGYDFSPLWNAEIRMCGPRTDYYSNEVYQAEDGMLLCAAQFGTYTIDPKSGKILKVDYSK